MAVTLRKHNKQFKSDSVRLAFLVWVKFSVYGGQIEYRGCVLHTLIGRYTNIQGFSVKSLLLIIFGSFAILPSLAIAKISVSEKYDFYEIYPFSKSEILDSLNNKTPISKSGEKFHGYAYSDVKWNFRWEYNNQSCWITSVNMTVDTKYTLPKLGTSVDDVNEIWNQWYPKLVEHEKGHHKLAIKIAKKIDNSILLMSSESKCSTLEKKANAIGYGYMSELDLMNVEYDQHTNHGETEGASLFSYL